MDSLVFRCPGCQQPFQVLAEQAGQIVRCPRCEDTVQIPAASPSKTEAVTPSESPPKQRENKAQSKADPAAKSEQKSEEVQAYGCPQCAKPFGIYPSMFGSEMACPHCQQTVLLQPKAKSSPAVASSPAVKSKPKPPPKPKSPPKPMSKAPVKSKPLPETADQKPKIKPPVSAEQSSQPPKSTRPSVSALDDQGVEPTTSDLSPSPVVADLGEQTAFDSTGQKTGTELIDGPVEAPVVAFVAQPVDHLLPPKFGAVDPAFFYRRHQDGSQVLLPSEDGSLKVVNNRIVKIEHNGQIYELISSPRYERIQRMVVTNVLAVIICGLLIAIVMTLLNG